MKSVLYHRIFEGKPFGHGGERRALQMQELMEQANVECHYYPLRGENGCRPLWTLWLIFKTYGWRLLLHPKHLWRTFRFINNNYTHNLRRFFERPEKTLLVEGTIEEFLVLFPLAQRYGKQVIAFPHNLESMVPKTNYLIGRNEKWQTFRNEIRWLKTCKEVYCIAEEETWLLRLWGVNAHYLPYEPPHETKTYLVNIASERNHRKQNTPLKILMTGSAINPPTAQGMQRVIDEWNAMEELLCGVELIVAGYGTNENLRITEGKTIRLLGALTDEQMQEEMIQCDAMLIYQPPTTGALTRIREAQIAHIPVIANFDAARSYHRAPLLFEYQSLQHLPAVIKQLTYSQNA